MNPKRKKFIAYSFIVIAVVYFGAAVYVVGKPVERYSAYKAADRMLARLANGNIEEAFDSVVYFDGPSERTPTIAYDNAKTIWTERVRQLQDSGISVKSYRDLKVNVDDGAIYGRVSLAMSEQGKVVEYMTHISFGQHPDGTFGVASLQPLSNNADNGFGADWQGTFSGRIEGSDKR